MDSTINHYKEMVSAYQAGDWESSLIKAGKFVEAVTKALYLHCGKALPPARQFKVGTILRALEQLTGHDDTVRLLIPRAGIFVYDIVSNRGARHDPDQIDPNKMDAAAVLPIASWILAEMIRFAAKGSSTPEETFRITELLCEKKYPYIEDIDGRLYVNIRDLNPRELGLLLLNAHYPNRISRSDLSAAIQRHGHRGNKVDVALTRLKSVVDDSEDFWKLRANGREEAERILSKNS
ncbi:MAG: hypothetical protein V4438_01565 [Patescibacteria group bacterium]